MFLDPYSKEPHAQLVGQIVPWIAQQNFHLLTGARYGVMEEASRVFQLARNAAETSGLAIGVFPDSGQENSWVELLIRTHLPAGNHGVTTKTAVTHGAGTGSRFAPVT